MGRFGCVEWIALSLIKSRKGVKCDCDEDDRENVAEDVANVTAIVAACPRGRSLLLFMDCLGLKTGS